VLLTRRLPSNSPDSHLRPTSGGSGHTRLLQVDSSWKDARVGPHRRSVPPDPPRAERNALQASRYAERMVEAVRTVVDESGVVADSHRRGLDSTMVDRGRRCSTMPSDAKTPSACS
jgi:hypothetical protein